MAAPRLLQDGGMLIMRAPAEPRSEAEVSMEQVTSWAREAGFTSTQTQYIYGDAPAFTIGRKQPELTIPRPMITAVFTR